MINSTFKIVNIGHLTTGGLQMDNLNIEFNLTKKKTILNGTVTITGIPDITWNNQQVRVQIFSIVDDVTTWLNFYTKNTMHNGKSDFETIVEFRANGEAPIKLHMERYATSVDEVIEFLSTADTEIYTLLKTLFNASKP